MNEMQKLVETLEIIEKNHHNLGKKMVQKLLYLMQRRGLDLELNYRIHFFGPYSAKLDDALHTLKNQELIDIDTSGSTHVVKVLNTEINGRCLLGEAERKIIISVVEDFASMNAFDLEAITTLDYVAKSLDTDDEDVIINKVMDIKGSKFKHTQLSEYCAILRKLNYVL